jgi:hypothetical protein
MRDISVRDRNIAFLIFGLLLACYLFTYTGVIDSSDGLAMFATAESIVRRGEVDSNQLLWMGLQQGSFGPDGELYSRKGLGMTLLAIPLVWLGRVWPALGLVQTALLLNPLLTAFSAALLYRTGRRLGWGQSTALAVALLYGLATLAWPYTQGFFSDPASGWGLLAALYGLLAHEQTGRKRYLLGGGAAWGMAYLARSLNLITLPIYLAALLVVLNRRLLWHSPAPALERLEKILTNWRPLTSFLIPVVAAGLLSLWWNWARYGNIWDSGYVESESFSGDWLAGLYGLLIGPARGFFWYSPVLLLAPGGGRWFWRHARWVLGVILSLSLVYTLVYAKWYMWHGGYSWGPRFLVPLAPFLALLIGPVWETVVQRRTLGEVGRILVVLAVILSVGVQWLGLLVPFALVQDWLAANVQPLFAPETFTRAALSPLVLQWQYITPQNIHLAWWRGERVDWSALMATVAAALLGFVQLARAQQHKAAAAPDARPQAQWLYGLFLCVLAIALLVRYQSTLSSASHSAIAGRIAQQEQQGDAILFLQPTQTQEFANVYHGALPTYGLHPRNTLTPEDEAWLNHLVGAYARLWVVPDATAPEQSGWERTLRMNDYLLQETHLPAAGDARFALYASALVEPLVEAGLGTFFGDPAAAQSGVDEHNGWIRLNGYALTTASRPGGAILLSLRWESIRQVDYDYHVFVHLLDGRGEKVMQRDGQPVQWMRPISTWRPGEEIVDHYGLLLADDMPTGEYTIAVGLYDPVSGQRLPISAGPGDFAIELGPILVERGS